MPNKPELVLAISVIFAIASVVYLRQNNIQMIILKDEVIQADKVNGDVEKALKNLRKHIYSHMNTSLSSGQNSISPPLQLKFGYERAIEAEKTRVAAERSRIYTGAQEYCQQQLPQSVSGGPRVQCVTDYVTSHDIKENYVDSSLYKFDFSSPAWTPDIAGISMVIAILCLLIFIILSVI